MVDDHAGPLLSIGEFGRRTWLSAKALRIYDRIGLLRPATIDPATGYRRYRVDQVRSGQLVAMLRGSDLSLAEIGLVIGDLDSGIEAAARLDRIFADHERQHGSRTLLMRHIRATLRGGGDHTFPIETRHVRASRVMSILRRLRAPETDGFVREAKTAFAANLHGAKATGPFTLIFHGVVDAESDGPIEATLGCTDDIQPTELIGIRPEPAHDEAYTTITKAQWAYPAILAAYDAVACCPELIASGGSRQSCREVYVGDPDDLGEDEFVCAVAFPLGEQEDHGEVQPQGDQAGSPR